MIPIIDLANKLAMKSGHPNDRSASVVAEVHGMAIGPVVDRVSDVLTISAGLLQPMPNTSMSSGVRYAGGIIAQPDSTICLLNLERMFDNSSTAKAS